MTHSQLIARLEELSGPDREIDALIWCYFNDVRYVGCNPIYGEKTHTQVVFKERGKRNELVTNGRNFSHATPYTASVDAAIALAEHLLPGWSWRVASCCVSDDAWVEPDYNCPVHGERLKRDFPPGQIDWVDLTDVDLRPSGRPAIALCIAILKAHGGQQ